jgi:hypothetical protein
MVIKYGNRSWSGDIRNTNMHIRGGGGSGLTDGGWGCGVLILPPHSIINF